VFVGSLEQFYKGPHVLIKALYQCVGRGHLWKLAMLGEGRCRPALTGLVHKLNLNDRVVFLGQVSPGQQVRDHLDHADLYVHPALTEGLPRSMIEAMARGLPCIGSRVGGIPELLEEDEMVEPGNVPHLAEKLISVMTDHDRLGNMSERNLVKAREYRCEALSRKRREFYTEVRARTETWLRLHQSP
jgi:glycosyltransferase involved in cell wall biosynthesis